MIGGCTYERITDEGLVVLRDGAEQLIPVDDVVLCAGQLPDRSLAGRLEAAGIAHHIIGGADVAAELDAKRAIDQGARLAARLLDVVTPDQWAAASLGGAPRWGLGWRVGCCHLVVP